MGAVAGEVDAAGDIFSSSINVSRRDTKIGLHGGLRSSRNGMVLLRLHMTTGLSAADVEPSLAL